MADITAVTNNEIRYETKREERVNCMRELRALVAEILSTADMMTAKDRGSNDREKYEYKDASKDHAFWIGDNGRINRNVKIVSFFIQMGTLGILKNPDHKEIGRLVANQVVSGFGDMRTAGAQVEMQKAGGREQLALADINKMAQQSNSTIKDGALELLKTAERTQDSAAHAG